MFARLAGLSESFESQAAQANPHVSYINQQQQYFDALPNIILSGSSGLKGFDSAIQTVDTVGSQYQEFAVPEPNSIFMPSVSPDLSAMARQCASSDIDSLIATKQPDSSIGCGWLYTAPNPGSPYPVLSKGFVGTNAAPINSFNPPPYKKWYFDLQMAKKQMLIDKCKALKDCTEVDSDIYQRVCGYCTDTNQGVPINNTGRPLYESDARANCSPESVVRSADKCPPPPPPGAGPQPIVDRTCDPVNGRLSSECMYRQVIAGGCTDGGTLATALQGSPNPNDYLSSVRDSDAVKLYNRVANPPLNLDIFRQGQTTVSAVLQEIRQLSSNTSQSTNTAIGAAARDLCLQRGAISSYDICSELSDGSTAPFDLPCLQSIFRQMGGQPKGTAYPMNANIATYNSMGNLGAVKQYFNQLLSQMNSKDYITQSTAMVKFLGIQPEAMINRAPYTQGVEVFWFIPSQWGDVGAVGGFLKRTIERDIVQYNPQPSRFSQMGNTANGAWLQVTDVRAQSDATVRYKVTVDDGFYITTNQPTKYDYDALTYGNKDLPGHFASMVWQGPTTYVSNQPASFKASAPNAVRMYFVDGGGWASFTVAPSAMSGVSPFQPKLYSLMCEPRAPFLTYEVNVKSGAFEELRNPAIFSRLLQQSGLDVHTRTDERTAVPGKKGFARMSQNSIININNIAFQSWKTMTVVLRFNSMPIMESIINMAMGAPNTFYYNLILKPLNGSTPTITIEYNVGNGDQRMNTPYGFALNTWYMFTIYNKGTGIDLQCAPIDTVVKSNGALAGAQMSIRGNQPLFSANGTWNPISPGHNKNACNVMIGSNGFRGAWKSMYGTAAFSYDLAWVHFFDTVVTQDDLSREASANWIYTQQPTGLNSYNA